MNGGKNAGGTHKGGEEDKEKAMNVLLTSAGRRTYMVDYFKKAVNAAGGGLVCAANSENAPALTVADIAFLTPLIYDRDYIPRLLEFCRMQKIDLLVPLFDIDLPILSGNREKFAQIGTTVVVGDLGGLKICNDKWETVQFLQTRGTAVPKSWLSAQQAADAMRRGEVEELVIKPRWGMGSIGVFFAEQPDEVPMLGKLCERRIGTSYLKYETAATPDQGVLYQERIRGQEFGMDVVCDLEGNYRTAWMREKISMRAGETDVARTLHSPEMEQIARRISLPGQRGNLDVDMIERDGVYYLFDMNERFGGGYPFSHMAGADLPAALIAWAQGKQPADGWDLVCEDEVFYKDMKICHAGNKKIEDIQ